MVFNISFDPKSKITIITTSIIPTNRYKGEVTNYNCNLKEALSSKWIYGRYTEATIVFVNKYSVPGTRFADNDNLPFKTITDILQKFLLQSDSSALISTIHIGEKSISGNAHATIYVFPFRLSEKNAMRLNQT